MVDSRSESKTGESQEPAEITRKPHKSLVDTKPLNLAPRNSRKMTDLTEVQEEKAELKNIDSKETIKKDLNNIKIKLEEVGNEGLIKMKGALEKGKKFLQVAEANLIQNRSDQKSPGGHQRNPSDGKNSKNSKRMNSPSIGYQGIVENKKIERLERGEQEINNFSGDMYFLKNKKMNDLFLFQK